MLDEGLEPGHVKSVRRDLRQLQRLHPIVCNDRHKPHTWSFAKSAAPPLPSVLDPQTALAVTLLAEHAGGTLPPKALEQIKPYVDHANRVLATRAGRALRRWPDKIRVLPPGLPLSPPTVSPEVHDVVYRSVFEEKQFRATYENAEGERKTHVVSPLALVLRGEMTRVVCTIRRPNEPLVLALDRIEAAEAMDAPVRTPDGFDLNEYIERGELGFRVGPGSLALRFLIRRKPGAFLRKCRLSEDQRVVGRDADWLLVEATVADTGELRQWLWSFGSALEVLEPTGLREELAEGARALAARYG